MRELLNNLFVQVIKNKFSGGKTDYGITMNLSLRKRNCRLRDKCQMVGIGHEAVFVAIVGDELDQPKLVLHSVEPDFLIKNNAFGFPAGTLLEVFHQGVVFEPGDEEDAVVSSCHHS